MDDPAYKRLFSRPRMVRDLLHGFAARDWSGALDFASLTPLPASFVSDDLRQRHGDMVWRVRFHAERWLYLVLLLEFQSGVDRAMAVRVLAYTALLYQRLKEDQMRPLAIALAVVFVGLEVSVYSTEETPIVWIRPVDLYQDQGKDFFFAFECNSHFQRPVGYSVHLTTSRGTREMDPPNKVCWDHGDVDRTYDAWIGRIGGETFRSITVVLDPIHRNPDYKSLYVDLCEPGTEYITWSYHYSGPQGCQIGLPVPTLPFVMVPVSGLLLSALAWIIREDGDSGGDTGASVWYKRCVHKRLATTETPA